MEWWYTVERESQSDLFSAPQSDSRTFRFINSLSLDCVSEWDEVPSDDEDKVIKENESKYVCLKDVVPVD